MVPDTFVMQLTTAKRELKPEQANAAHTLDRHVSVTAGPGSGKTTVLVERYIQILRKTKNLSIDQIVAITFTNRAANEMRERLRHDLDLILRNASGEERQRWMRYKRTLDGAIITTIHGFCARLLREFPVEARIDPQFLLLDNHDSAILLEAAVEETLTEFISRERDLISQLAVGFGRAKLAEGLVQLYGTVRGQGLKLDELAERTADSHSPVTAHKDALANLERTMNDFMICDRLTPAAEVKRSHARSSWARLSQLLQSERPALAEYCAAIEAFRAEARPSKSGRIAGLVDLLDEQLWGEKKDGVLGLVPQICFDLFARDFARELIHVLKEIERRYREKKHNLTALDFDDLQLRALELLHQPSVLMRATARYRFFLVDEFQDTNSLQREFMHQLALSLNNESANLFIVGDRKQSIYGFRGADVDVFQQMTEALKSVGGIEQPLHLNFRSQSALINFFNHLFARLFQVEEHMPHDELAELGFVAFEPSNEQRDQRDAGPLVELLVDTRSPAEDDPKAQRTPAERDARQVAQRILSLTRPGDETSREFRDIALLFRAMTDVPEYESVLRNANIPFQTVQGKGFYEREEITDLIQLLRFLDNKTDELALAAVLRSPLGGVSDNALLALRCAPWMKDAESQEFPRFFSQPRKLFGALRRHKEIAYIGNEDHAQLERAVILLRKLIDRLNHSPIADLLRFAVEESEYLTVIAANFDGAQRLANVQKLFTLAERFESSGAYLIRDLVRYVEEFEAIGSREGEGQIDDSANAVRLMTIHQAKGLEFPVVIIPNLHHRSSKPQEHWFLLDRHRGLTVKIPDGRGKHVVGCTFEKFRNRSKLREHFESIRLLYVAATRAQDRLILTGVTDDLTKLNGTADNWLKLIWQKLELQVSRSSVLDPGPDVQLAVTLNLADHQIERTAETTVLEVHKTGVTGSLFANFPLIQPVDPEPVGGHQFSVTQLINYRRCPRQYYFDRILHVPTRDEVAVWNDAETPEPPANLTATLKGAVIHRFCETYVEGEEAELRLRQSFAEVLKARQAQLADRLPDINAEEAHKELWPLARNYLSSDLFRRVQQARTLAPTSSNGLAANLPERDAGLWSELSFRLRRPQGFITGTIDKLLVSRTALEGSADAGSNSANRAGSFEVEIIDFKTNRFRSATLTATPQESAANIGNLGSSSGIRPKRARPTRSDANQFVFNFSSAVEVTNERMAGDSFTLDDEVKRAAADYQLQMQAYALAVYELLPGLADSGRIKVTLHFLQPDREVQVPPELLEESVCAQAIDDAMVQIISATDPDEFAAYPEVHCRMCNFLDLCNPGRTWLRESAQQEQLVG